MKVKGAKFLWPTLISRRLPKDSSDTVWCYTTWDSNDWEDWAAWMSQVIRPRNGDLVDIDLYSNDDSSDWGCGDTFRVSSKNRGDSIDYVLANHNLAYIGRAP